MPATQQVAFVPAFERVLGEHLHDAAVGGELPAVGVFSEIVGQPELLADFVDGVELVRRVFIGAEDAEVGHVALHDVAKELAKHGLTSQMDKAYAAELQGADGKSTAAEEKEHA